MSGPRTQQELRTSTLYRNTPAADDTSHGTPVGGMAKRERCPRARERMFVSDDPLRSSDGLGMGCLFAQENMENTSLSLQGTKRR
ncbi:hypothetical protein JTE90_017836 [Oedothorax gibbosus]|uniref:Uncharacterized protein n=1 Tax=Oedothorax gibbosus TaxID=931172 RepID=A0AAV6VAW5_9ARAC|nr:hypothetical protein JTE90_017836 [Oedothorax gibbosus]